MSTIKKDAGKVNGARVAVLLGLSIGLGIAVHEVFLLAGFVIAAGALAIATAHALHEHAEQSRLIHHHL